MRVFIWGDTHFPFHHEASYQSNLRAIKTLQPHAVVQIGDLKDKYVFSNYPRNTSFISPEEEVKAASYWSVRFWKEVQQAMPKAKCYQVLGNHDMRIAKRIAEKFPELEAVYSLTNEYKFKGVETLPSDQAFLELDGVIYCHGWLSESIDHAKYFNKPCVHGHRHRPGIYTFGAKLWSMDVGYIADKAQLPLQYTQSTMKHWRRASGIVEARHPQLILLGDE